VEGSGVGSGEGSGEELREGSVEELGEECLRFGSGCWEEAMGEESPGRHCSKPSLISIPR
jgi:hypothetical protein